ncbi:Benzoyl-CoA oxygenase component B (boxB) [Plesiocystis pacifica SIR-1]|uniref:Benzoyl-CoA oxygenase component B (BoxB) n=1 Tax=Plesiocystis pacifica SIR-1 TaxID=391625 RepID=A6GGT2_9BACT|nr:benzoyl-CoA 2,3-epoxidase subunit BoxB [Plesiocystis pacifica]EDM74929.1 Benzoyl-CoA oxygenase component B (boxB) [Plesiocystis pacifica SIR-1]
MNAPVDLNCRIPNNVGLADDPKVRRALERWQPKYLQWWHEMGPTEYEPNEVWLRTAISVDSGGWANYDYVRMPEYRWGIFLTPREEQAVIRAGDMSGAPAWEQVPGEFRNALRRIVVTQADTEPASVEQQRLLGRSAPSLYDMRNLFQVNVEEGRHLWAMAYLLYKYFGKDGREEAGELLERRSGDPDKPRILGAFNQPCDNWLSFFAFTMFTDRDGKFQLAALRESGFDPLARSCDFMLTEEAFHLFVGETGLARIIKRAAELERIDPNGDVRNQGGIDMPTMQRAINYWFSHCLDLFGGEISNNAASYFGAGLKGRFREADRYTDHRALDDFYTLPVIENGELRSREVPLRNAMNEVLRDEYVKDCERAVRKWNRLLEKEGSEHRLRLPSRRFHRHQGIYSDHCFNPEGELISREAFEAKAPQWLLGPEDRRYLDSIMKPVRESGKFANWIAPPTRGLKGKPIDFEYVR